LLSPDQAATMASGAWQVISDGADVTDRALALVLDTLDAAGAGAASAPGLAPAPAPGPEPETGR